MRHHDCAARVCRAAKEDVTWSTFETTFETTLKESRLFFGLTRIEEGGRAEKRAGTPRAEDRPPAAPYIVLLRYIDHSTTRVIFYLFDVNVPTRGRA